MLFRSPAASSPGSGTGSLATSGEPPSQHLNTPLVPPFVIVGFSDYADRRSGPRWRTRISVRERQSTRLRSWTSSTTSSAFGNTTTSSASTTMRCESACECGDRAASVARKQRWPKLTLTPAGGGRRLRITASDRKSTRLNSSHSGESRMPSSA